MVTTSARVGHTGAVAVLAGHLDLGRDACHGFQPVLGRAAAVVAGATGQDQHLVDVLENPVGTITEQLGGDAFDTFERVGDGTGLLEDFLLHVMPVRAQFGCPAVRMHRADRPVGGVVASAFGIGDPVAAQLQVHQVALLQVNDLVGHTGQGHGVTGQELFRTALAHPQDQGRTSPGAHHPMGLVLVKHGQRIGAMQALHRRLQGPEEIALVMGVDQVGDHLGVGLAFEHISPGLQLCPQFVVVLDDAVVHQRHPPGRTGGNPCTVAEMGVCVVHRRRAMRGPACVGDAGAAGQVALLDLACQLGHPRRAARPLQTGRVHGHATRVIAAVLQPLQALHQHGNDVTAGNAGDDATHGIPFNVDAVRRTVR
jgi:hypothetical protein